MSKGRIGIQAFWPEYRFVLKPLKYDASQKQHIPHDIQVKSIRFHDHPIAQQNILIVPVLRNLDLGGKKKAKAKINARYALKL